MLHDPARHEALISSHWNEASARDRLRRLAQTLANQYSDEHLWPEHPDDVDWSPKVPMTSVFWGAAGTAWALLTLREHELIEKSSLPAAKTLQKVKDIARRSPDTPANAPGFLCGRSGILAVIERFDPSETNRQELFQALRETIKRPENELMWGAPGALVAARLLFDRTGDDRFLEVIREASQHLLKTWLPNVELDCFTWRQDLYGKQSQYLGPVHGSSGNVFALLRAGACLSTNETELVLERAEGLFLRTAKLEEGLVNWPAQSVPQAQATLLQWCHGAPGMIVAASAMPLGRSSRLEKMLLQAGELVWKAGPLQKPFGLCHGTAGNGYALLKLFRRTGDTKWLDRARHFALHALKQSDIQAEVHGHRRAGLLTGDAGLCMFLWSCIESDDRWPLLDVI